MHVYLLLRYFIKVMYALVLPSILYVKRFRIMSTTFGVHIGNTSACIAVSKEGKTDVVANDAGDR